MRSRVIIAGLAGVAATMLGASSLIAGDGDNDRGPLRSRFVVSADLVGYQEVPSSLSTTGHGRFWALVDTRANTITFRLTYDALEGAVTQSHVHIGQNHTNGGISFFLCTNGTPPAGQAPPLCPTGPAVVTGVITAENIIGPLTQGVEAQNFAEVVAALRSGNAYANVHSSLYPAGEIRGQLH